MVVKRDPREIPWEQVDYFPASPPPEKVVGAPGYVFHLNIDLFHNQDMIASYRTASEATQGLNIVVVELVKLLQELTKRLDLPLVVNQEIIPVRDERESGC